jgi:hypothetical protein
MIGYVARDLNESLWFHYFKPKRKEVLAKTMFWESDERAFQIYDTDFPEFKDLKWKDKPIRVGFNVHKANIQD